MQYFTSPTSSRLSDALLPLGAGIVTSAVIYACLRDMYNVGRRMCAELARRGELQWTPPPATDLAKERSEMIAGAIVGGVAVGATIAFATDRATATDTAAAVSAGCLLPFLFNCAMRTVSYLLLK